MSLGYTGGITINSYNLSEQDISGVHELIGPSYPIVLTAATNFSYRYGQTYGNNDGYTIRYDVSQDMIRVRDHTDGYDKMFLLPSNAQLPGTPTTYVYAGDIYGRSNILGGFAFSVTGSGTYRGGVKTDIVLSGGAARSDTLVLSSSRFFISWDISNVILSDLEDFQIVDLKDDTLFETSTDVASSAPNTSSFQKTYTRLSNEDPVAYMVIGRSGGNPIMRSNIVFLTPVLMLTLTSATAGDGSITVNWTESVLTPNNYSVVVSDGMNPTIYGNYVPGYQGGAGSGPNRTGTFTGLTNETTYTVLIDAQYANNYTPGLALSISNLTPSGGGGPVPCFPTGTMIRTIAGDKPVETLSTGDYVLTADNRPVPVRMHFFTVEKATEANAPYVVPANALGYNQPRRTLHLSPHHAFQVRPNVWQMPLLAAERSTAIQQYGLGEPVTYYHVECPNFFRDNLVADGVVCESFGSNQTKGLKGIYRYASALGGYTRVSGPTFAKRS